MSGSIRRIATYSNKILILSLTQNIVKLYWITSKPFRGSSIIQSLSNPIGLLKIWSEWNVPWTSETRAIFLENDIMSNPIHVSCHPLKSSYLSRYFTISIFHETQEGCTIISVFHMPWSDQEKAMIHWPRSISGYVLSTFWFRKSKAR